MKSENIKKVSKLLLVKFNIKETIAQLKYNGGSTLLMAWGARNFVNFFDKGLLFRVSGFKHKGYVLITLSGNDTYTVNLLNMKCDVVKTMDEIYWDELTEKIDEAIELTKNYEKDVDKFMGKVLTKI